ncbi:hypothetical protein, partial [Rhizobium pisi]|uniref:hypothetical protein n=3 Tax=Rhizobium pisi TaxID=574561 RepID=UPI001ABFB53F
KTGHGVSRNLLLRPLPTRPAKNPIAKKAKPAEKIDGFVSSLTPPLRRSFFIERRASNRAPYCWCDRLTRQAAPQASSNAGREDFPSDAGSGRAGGDRSGRAPPFLLRKHFTIGRGWPP